MSLTNDALTVPKVITESFTLNGTEITGIVSTLDGRDGDKIPTAMAVFTGLNTIKQQMAKLTTEFENNEDIVITAPLVSPVFAEGNGYQYNNWEILSLQAIYTSEHPDNYILIPSIIFPGNGHYLFNIKVTKLPNGKLELKDKDGITVFVITAPGDYYIDVNVEFSDSTSYRLVASDVTVGEIVIVPYLAVHKITDRFYNYLINKINELASLDGGGYVDRVLFETRLTEMTNDFNVLIGIISANLQTHISDSNNPHQVTPLQINAADRAHTHTPESIGAALAVHTHALESLGAAPVVHEHAQYLIQSQIENLITAGVKDGINSIQNVTPMSAVLGPVGILPDEFQSIGVTPPSQIVFTNGWNPSCLSDYDIEYGMATSNFAPVDNGLVINAFAKLDNTGNLPYGRFTLSNTVMEGRARLALHYQLHRERTLIGYVFRHPDSVFATQWKFYTNFNTLIHLAERHVLTGTEYAVYFPEPIRCKSMSWIFEEVTDVNFGINIEPLFADMSEEEIGISNETLLLSIPRNGNNMLFNLDVEDIVKITPQYNLANLPLHIYLNVDDNGVGTIGMTYLPLEVGVHQEGSDILTSAFTTDALVVDALHNPFTHITHPIFGTLELANTTVTPTVNLNRVYANTENWEINTNEVSLIHTFTEPTWVRGYVLEWDLNSKDNMPDEWSLTLLSETGEAVIVDSISAHGERLTIDRNRVRYVGRFDRSIKTKTMNLFMQSNTNTTIALTSWKPMLVGDFYGIQFNTMLNGTDVVKRIYLGSAVYDNLKNSYSIVHQLTIGTQCTVPVNNFQTTIPNQEYMIPNPYRSTEISGSLRVLGGDTSAPPSGYILAISADYITVKVYSRHIFALILSRNW